VTGALPIQLWKELRALLPWWAALVPTVAILGAAGQMQGISREGEMRFLLAAGFVYVAGAAALGALSFGHDYGHRTLGSLLALPVSRKRLLSLKAAVLLPLLGLMGLVAVFTVGLQQSLVARYGVFNQPEYQLMILGPMLAGALLAPWLTIVARGPLAGAVFSVAIPVLIWMICNSFLLGTDIVWRATLALAAVGGVMTVRTFLRQESIDGPPAELARFGWLRRSERVVADAGTRPPGWVATALWKELRLQQMTFVVAGLFVAAWAAILFARWANPANEYLGPSLYAVSSLYLGVVGIMAGALPAAEERHFGTADWQLLMPVAAWKQWALKCAVAIGLAMILTLGLPALLNRLLPAPDVQFYWQMVLAVLYFSVTGLYLSSISPTGLRAILGTAPALAAITVTGAALFQPVGGAVRALAWSVAVDWLRPGSLTRQTAMATGNALFCLFAAGLSLLVLTLAFHNHRSADRSRRRIVRQVAVILGAAAVAALVLIVVGMFLAAAVGSAR
jgi:hypothetical protein